MDGRHWKLALLNKNIELIHISDKMEFVIIIIRFMNLTLINYPLYYICSSPEKEATDILFLSGAVCCPCLSFTDILSPLKFDGPKFESLSLHSWREPIWSAMRPTLFNSCSVFRISQCSAQRHIDVNSSSRIHVRSSRSPLNLKWLRKQANSLIDHV